MAWRDVPGWAVYFASYEKMKEVGETMSKDWKCSEDQVAMREFFWNLNAGGIAGVISWIVSIP